MDDRDMYREEILEHYRHPQNFGAVEKPTHIASAANPLCGDMIVLALRINKKRIVKDIGFTGLGCALSTASASFFTEWMRGKTLAQLQKVKENQLLRLIEVPIMPVRHQCALLPLAALRKALESL